MFTKSVTNDLMDYCVSGNAIPTVPGIPAGNGPWFSSFDYWLLDAGGLIAAQRTHDGRDTGEDQLSRRDIVHWWLGFPHGDSAVMSQLDHQLRVECDDERGDRADVGRAKKLSLKPCAHSVHQHRRWCLAIRQRTASNGKVSQFIGHRFWTWWI